MEKICTSIGVLLMVSYTFACFGQRTPIGIGDSVPQVQLSKIINYSKTSAKLLDFQDNLLIVDFWATWCSPCVKMLPVTDSLQKVMGGKVKFLPVTYEDTKVAGEFLEKIKKFKGITIPSVVNDTVLNRLFPHSSIPYYVWIKGGRVIATTEANEITRENIEKAINSSTPNIKSIVGRLSRTINQEATMFINGIHFTDGDTSQASLEIVDTTNIVYQSIVSRYIPELTPGAFRNDYHCIFMNENITNMYQFAFGIAAKPNTMAFYNKSRYKIELADSAKRNAIVNFSVGAEYEHWLETNGFSFELIWKNIEKANRVNFLMEELDRYFGRPMKIQVGLEKRVAPSNVLVVAGDTSKLRSQGGAPFEKHDAYSYSQKNMPLSRFIRQLDYYWQMSDKAVFNDVKLTTPVDLELNCNMSDVEAVNKELKKYGLKFIDGDRPADVLVFKDRVE